MTYRALLDACALYPVRVRDTLLALAEEELYDVFWSDRILEEARRNLIKNGHVTERSAESNFRAMSTAFQDAVIPMGAVELMEPSMTNHPKDRHVLAAAVAGRADVIVTMNLRDFAEEACAVHHVRAVHPDEFLLTLLINHRARVVACLRQQARILKRPPRTFEEHLDGLSRMLPQFVAAVRG